MRMAGTSPAMAMLVERYNAPLPCEIRLFRQRRDAREEEVTGYPDQDEIGQQDQRPAEIVANDFAFIADELARGYADAGGLRRDRLADLRAHRVERG